MTALRRMIAAVRNVFHARQVESDLDAEIHAYVESVTEEQIAAGLTPEEARRKALARAHADVVLAATAGQARESRRSGRTCASLSASCASHRDSPR